MCSLPTTYGFEELLTALREHQARYPHVEGTYMLLDEHVHFLLPEVPSIRVFGFKLSEPNPATAITMTWSLKEEEATEEVLDRLQEWIDNG